MQDEVVVPGVKVQGPEKVPVPLLLKVTTDLLGPPNRVDDVWLWRV